jgi:hypothetical protein
MFLDARRKDEIVSLFLRRICNISIVSEEEAAQNTEQCRLELMSKLAVSICIVLPTYAELGNPF